MTTRTRYERCLNPRYYNPEGQAYEGTDREILLKWAADFNLKNSRRFLAKTEILGGEVSTVWLGIDHSFSGARRPLIYETMVFLDKEGARDQDVERYSTRAEALAGHERMVRKWRADRMTTPPRPPEGKPPTAIELSLKTSRGGAGELGKI